MRSCVSVPACSHVCMCVRNSKESAQGANRGPGLCCEVAVLATVV